MNRVNKETLVKLIILSLCSFFYLKFIINGDLLKFIHPRLIPFIKFSVILMIVIAIFLLFNLSVNSSRRACLKQYRIFLIPLIIILLIDPSADISNMQPKNNSITKSENLSPAGEEENNDIEESTVNGEIIFNNKNFVSNLEKIYSDTDSIIGCKVELTGFVYHDEALPDKSFVIARYLMVCCASDMQVVGLLCKDNNSYEDNSWLKISGTIKKNDENAIDAVYVQVDKAERVDPPAEQYIYP